VALGRKHAIIDPQRQTAFAASPAVTKLLVAIATVFGIYMRTGTKCRFAKNQP
jgi:hypothetical protein